MRVEAPERPLPTPPTLLEAAHSQWMASCLKVRISALHHDVSQVLRSMGLPITIEQLTDDRLFSIDIAIPGLSHAINLMSSSYSKLFTVRCRIAAQCKVAGVWKIAFLCSR